VGSLDDFTIAEVVRRYHDRPVQIDRGSLARIGHEREEAGRRPGADAGRAGVAA
jgi:hypothetical protein